MSDKPTTLHPNKEAIVFYQGSGEEGIPEPAVVLNPYSDILSLDQKDQSININYESIPEFIKCLKLLHYEWKQKEVQHG